MMNLKPTTTEGESIGEDFSSRGLMVKRSIEAKMRTILYVKEVEDNEKDFLNMEMKEFITLSREELLKAYKNVMKANYPIFSGAIDTLINKIDYRKVLAEEKNQINEYGIKEVVSKKRSKKVFNEIEQ